MMVIVVLIILIVILNGAGRGEKWMNYKKLIKIVGKRYYRIY